MSALSEHAQSLQQEAIAELRVRVLHAEHAVFDMNRQLMASGNSRQQITEIETELTEITEDRDLMRARLNRLEGERGHGRRSITALSANAPQTPIAADAWRVVSHRYSRRLKSTKPVL
jgi:chromosome segregation ATPase